MKEEKTKKKEIQVSRLEHDGKLYEVIHDNKQSYFITFKEGEIIQKLNKLEIEGKIFKPANNEAVKTGCVTLPKGIIDYENEEDLIQEIKEHIHKYLEVKPEYETFATYYILLSWIQDKLTTLPYLRALGDWGTGKSRFLRVIGGLCYKPIRIAGAVTPAPIYRLLSFWRGTLIIEEADRKKSDTSDEIIKILNCGFEKNNPIVRCDKENPKDIETHDPFGCKVICTRFSFYDQALESRCLTENMKETEREDIPVILPQEFYEEQEILQQKLLMYRLKNWKKINLKKIQEIDLGKHIEKRIKQAASSFAVLFLNNEKLMEKFLEFITKYQKKLIAERNNTIEGQIALYLYDVFSSEEEDETSVTPQEIADTLKANGYDKIAPNTVGKYLKALGLKTIPRRVGKKTHRFLVWDAELLSKLFKKYVEDYSLELQELQLFQEKLGGQKTL